MKKLSKNKHEGKMLLKYDKKLSEIVSVLPKEFAEYMLDHGQSVCADTSCGREDDLRLMKIMTDELLVVIDAFVKRIKQGDS